MTETTSSHTRTRAGYRRFVLALFIVAATVATFWSVSRYPALNDKAIMGGSIQLEDPLSFEALFPIQPGDPLLKKVFLSTINWVKTNQNGMIFGVLFGAAFMTLLDQLRRRAFKSKFLNTILGFTIGAPLGVCVNCAAPIAQGLYKGGARLETSLAAMIASPTFNVIVLTMMFSLLPLYLVVTKIALTLLIIFVVIPLITPRINVEDPAQAIGGDGPILCEIGDLSGVEHRLSDDVFAIASGYGQNLWYIIKKTVPLMLVAGALGSAAAHLLPYETVTGLDVTLVNLFVVALFGLLLPAPIAFDVILAATLLGAGLPVPFVMVMLFTLGIFSIYSFMVVSRMASWRLAARLSAIMLVAAVICGTAIDHYHQWQTRKALDILRSGIDFNIISSAHASEKPDSNITINKVFDFSPRSPKASKPFSRIEAHHIGIDRPIEFAFEDMWAPFWTTNGSVALADLDMDGDLDFVLGRTDGGVMIFNNDGQGRFRQLDVNLPAITDKKIVLAAPADLNNDGWLDLYLTSHKAGNFIAWSNAGSFDDAQITPSLNRPDAIVTMALAFGDVDRDGDLDAAVGNFATGWYRRIPGEESRNRLVLNDGKLTGKQFTDLSGLPGETLSILLSDFTGDRNLDLIVGNDFAIPDMFYVGGKGGKFKRIRRGDDIIESTTTTTMSVKTADLDNDLIPELYIAQIAGQAEDAADRINFQPNELYCSQIERAPDKQVCQKNVDIRTWYRPGRKLDPSLAVNCLKLSGKDIESCKALMVKDLAIQNKKPEICQYIKPDQTLAQQFCADHFIFAPDLRDLPIKDNVKQIPGRNVLLVRNQDGKFKDHTLPSNLELGGWSWDNKFADLDNDGLQDLYVVNGWWPRQGASPSNVFFSNNGSLKFADTTEEFGLEDYFVMPAAAAGDIDNDGDLDMIAAPINAPMIAYINNSQSGNSVRIELVDETANRFGVGSRISIHYGPNETKKQMRELQLGGGFNSFDPIEAHFGLGADKRIGRIDVEWSTGETSSLTGPFSANAKYKIKRTVR